ncbi:MAG TPA: hypothetical protein VKO87_12905 [Gemmatimonadaceae bacterium]|nr:hypothetical protein [Gemmatimonadaceae bacterium]
MLSLNLSRRHLSESQRAMVAAKISALSVQGGERDKGGKSANLHLDTRSGAGKSANLHHSIPTIAEAAESLNVSPRATKDARKIIEHATPALRKAVERNEIAVSTAAKLADAPAKTQRAAVEGGKTVAREIASRIVDAKAESPKPPIIRTLGLDVPAEVMARAAKEQDLVDKIGKLLAEAKRTYTELEKIRGVEQVGKGNHISTGFRTAINELSSLQGTRPASACPHCKLIPDLRKTCACCRSAGFIGERDLNQVEKCLLAEGDDAGVWIRGQWKTYAEATGERS